MRSLTLKLSLAFLVVGLVGVVLVAAVVGRSTAREFDQFILDRFQAETIDELTSYYESNGSWDGLEIIYRRGNAGHGGPPSRAGSGVMLLDGDGRVLAVSNASGALPEPDVERALPINVDGEVVGYVQFVGGGGAGIARQSPEALFLQRINRAILLSAAAAGSLALALGILLADTISRPVRELTQATQAVAGGDLGAQVPVRGADEIGELARSFNRMSADLAQSNQVRKQMTADIAHDLRTPLSVILGYSEALQDGKLPASPEIYGAIHLQAQQLNRLIDDLRTLSLADAGQLSLQRRAVEPLTLLEHTALAYLPQAEGRDIRLTVEGQAGTLVVVDPDRLVQVLGNLVGNALRHTPDGGRITLSTGTVGGRALLSVEDSGPGIPPEDLPHIFERFYRGDKARASDGASGLGLAIARSLVQAHGGQLTAENRPQGGARFTVALPLAVGPGVAAG